ncbi:MAG: Lar family restriction alleviation protein, partial [Clostridia bacterium]|nr:Lar family restriction alleviation protein [Clostridia bacterium]
ARTERATLITSITAETKGRRTMVLKPCPFCGKSVAHCGTIAEHDYTDKESSYYEYDNTHYDVVCSAIDGGCGASVGKMYETPESAAEAWNRRANNGTA